MSGMEDQIQQLLQDPESMGRIMQLAQQLSGSMDTAAPPPAQTETQQPDPQLMARLLPLVGELRQPNTQAAQLLYALRPFLKEERQGKVERAVRLAHLIHVGKKLIADGGFDLV